MQNSIYDNEKFTNVDGAKFVSGVNDVSQTTLSRGGRNALKFDPQQPDQRRARQSAPPNQPPYGQVYPVGPPQYPNGAYPPPVGGLQGYPQGGYQSPPPRPQNGAVTAYNSPLVSNWRRFMLNQAVQVNIQGHGWLVGSVVAIIHAVQAITGSHVKVRYVDTGRQAQEDVFPNDPEFIRPY